MSTPEKSASPSSPSPPPPQPPRHSATFPSAAGPGARTHRSASALSDDDKDRASEPAEADFDPDEFPVGASIRASGSYLSTMFTGLIRRFSSDDHTQLDGSNGNMMGAGVGGAHNQYSHPDVSQLKDGVNGVFTPVGVASRTASPFRPPPLEPLALHGYKDGTTRLLSAAVAEEVRAMVPERLKIVEDWALVYSLEQDGASLATLYQKCRQFERRRVGFVLVVRDQEGGTFGAYLSDYPRPAPSYFGNGECFLWRASTLASLPPPPSVDTTNLTRNTTLAPPPPASTSNSSTSPSASRSSTPSETIRFKAFPYSGLNDCYIHCETDYLSVGSGGGHYGLWLDDSLGLGHSSRCETFGNEPLSDEGQKFGVLGVELWVIGG